MTLGVRLEKVTDLDAVSWQGILLRIWSIWSVSMALQFDDEMGRIQRAFAECGDIARRRSIFFEALNLRPGEHVLEIGCGGGSYLSEAAASIGPEGRLCAVDITEEQLAAAKERCAECSWIEFRQADAVELPYEDAVFDVVYCVQVIEYVKDLDRTLHEIHRVLRPGGRLLNIATDWNSAIWYSHHPERMQKVLTAWADHSVWAHIPSILPARLRNVGMQPTRQTPIPLLNMSYNGNAASYWAARLVRAYVVNTHAITEEEGDAWFEEFDTLESKDEYHFYTYPIMTEAIKVS